MSSVREQVKTWRAEAEEGECERVSLARRCHRQELARSREDLRQERVGEGCVCSWSGAPVLAQGLEALGCKGEGWIIVEEAEADGGGMGVFAPARADGGSQLYDMEDHLVILAWKVGK
ncbi:hypothetical protein [Ktedonospora formicarum]|uniref:Uncharacterized protein n=1 Tax=Ktedonospora formicarum TaxID=2778364 RepID=A0A8J3MW85_9CHLR|nr:hypothetical protein [Ktedonospora formicarum]GHO51177.1 hypothetical protein KSX_93400 [Ktedonospora formicarum]